MPDSGWYVAGMLRSRIQICLRPAVLILAGLIGLAGLLPQAVQAREVSITGAPMQKFGRILLQFDQPTKVSARAANGVLVISFADSARVTYEKLAADLPGYIASVRRDPDGSGLRLALVGNVRLSQLDAGERVYVDLLPPNWVGLPPALPPEVVAELAERARNAEQKLREEALRKVEPSQPIAVRVAELPGLTRFVFEPPAGTPIQVRETAGGIEGTFAGPFVLDLAGTKPKLAAGVKSFATSNGERSLTVKVGAAAGYTARGFSDDGTLVVDLATPAAAAAAERPRLPEPKAAPHAAEPAKPKGGAAADVPNPAQAAAHAPAPAHAEAGHAPEPKPEATKAAVVPSPVAGHAASATAPVVAAAAPANPPPARPPGPVVPAVESGPDTVSILFPFQSRTAAAAFQSASGLVLVFDTLDHLQPPALSDAVRKVVDVEAVSQDDRFAVVRLTLPDARAMRFEPEGNGWRLILGGRDALPPDALKVTRTLDEIGNPVVAVDMRAASAAFWMQDGPGGRRIAVVTGFGRPQGLPSAMNFVEFGLSATLQGLVVEARADDLTVSLSSNGVLVSRKSGLSLSPQAGSGARTGAGEDGLVLARENWLREQAGDVYARYKEYILAAATAPRAGRAEARFREARFLVANSLDQEAVGMLALARADDAGFGRRREVQLLSGIASLRAGRLRDARGFLSSELLVDDPEAVLWRAVLDTKQRRFPQATAGFRRAERTIGLYAEDLAATLRTIAFQAMIETGDVSLAEAQLAAIDQLPSDLVRPDVHDLMRARLDEAAGRKAAALKTYARLIEEAPRPVWAEASLRYVVLSTRSDSGMTPDQATQRLEVLSAAWRGDEIEIGTLLELSRVYGKAGRWRDAFNVMRRASRAFPSHDLTRVLQDETSQLFERLFLGDLGETLSSVEALGLYFDFRELAPVGRRGDEIVRRLADRLVEIDLLDQAAELLQHQVDKRLTGAARAAVAARLAAVQLLNGKPALALTALHTTRIASLPEEVRQFRTLLEAQTLADLSRTDLALETLEGETGLGFDRLRMNILWGARRWRDAGVAAEALVGLRWGNPEPLADRDRADVLRAAIAYALADEPLDLGRVRSKFGTKMADSPDAKVFADILRPNAPQSREFRAAALKVSKEDSLRTLLADWKAAHPGTVTEPVTRPVPAAPSLCACLGGATPPPG
jgi:tetratricopeptide (TPR) repeat protein